MAVLHAAHIACLNVANAVGNASIEPKSEPEPEPFTKYNYRQESGPHQFR